VSDGFDLMLGVFRSPARSSLLRTRELPDDMLEVIRVAAGDEAAIAAARTSTRLNDADLQVAASLLLHNMILFDGADSYRTLGVRHDADSPQIKMHYRWLVRWLHPDRNPDAMHTVFADRINRAWNSIRTDERRGNYDLSLRAERIDDDADKQVPDTPAILREWTRRSPVPLLSGRLVRRLPKIVAVGVGLVALIALGLAAWLASSGSEKPGELLATTSDRHAEEGGLTATPSTSPSMSERQSAAPAAARVPEPSPVRATAFVDQSRPPLITVPPASLSEALASPKTAAHAAVNAALAGDAHAVPPTAVAGFTHVLPVARAMTQIPEPPATPPAATVFEAATAPLSAADLNNFIEGFQRLYGADDVEPFLALFSMQARGNGGEYAELAGDYRRLFRQRRQRRLRLSDLSWQVDGDRAVLNGSYEAWVGATADQPQSNTHGQIMLQLTRGKDGVRITQLHHTVNE